MSENYRSAFHGGFGHGPSHIDTLFTLPYKLDTEWLYSRSEVREKTMSHELVMGDRQPEVKHPQTGRDPGKRNLLLYESARVVFTLIMRLYVVRFYVAGAEHLPSSGPVLLVSNHQSKIDPFLIAWPLRRPVSIPGKASLFRLPVVGYVLRQLGGYPVEQDVADVNSLRTSIHVLRNGQVLGVFPEGHRSRTEEILPFLPTITKVAIRQRVPILPAAIAGSRALLAPGKVIPHPFQPLVVLYGQPFELEQYYNRPLSDEELAVATEQVRNRVVALYTEAERIRRSHRIFEGHYW
jgi:1-acyl-sn-glycerol-3-phosphate acyltransferase